MKYRINIVHTNNSDGIYIDNQLTYQDYQINPMEFLLHLKIHIPGSAKLNDLIVDEWWADEEWAKKLTRLPKYFDDVKKRF